MRRAQGFIAAFTTCMVLTSIAPASFAEQVFYRWTNERGHTVHSDRPPPEGVDYEVVSTGSTFSREVTSDEGAVPLDVDPSVSNDFDQLDNARQVIEKNPEYCQRARDNIKVLDSSVQIQMRDKQGNLRNINSEERALQRQKAMDTIAVHCD